MKPIDTLVDQSAQLVTVKEGDAYNNNYTWVFKLVIVGITVIWDFMPCGLVERYQLF
jgi:hypothetical protein